MSTEPFDWDPFKDMGGGGFPFVKFINPGDEIVGTIIAVRAQLFKGKDEKTACVDVRLKEPVATDDGQQIEVQTLSVDKVDLVRQVPLFNPQVNDLIAVRYVKNEQTPNGVMKIFDVRVKKAGEPHIPGAVSAPQPPPPAVEEYAEKPF